MMSSRILDHGSDGKILPAQWELALLYAGGGALAGAVLFSLWQVLFVTRPPLAGEVWPGVLAALICYGIAHCLRALRLVIVLSGEGVSLRRLAVIHLYTSGSALFLPWKLGDVFRLVEVARALGKPATALIAVWVERVFDIVAIGIMLALLAATGIGWDGSWLFVSLWAVAAALSIFAFVFVPPILSMTILFLIKTYRTGWSLRLIRVFHIVREALTMAPKLIYGPKFSLVCITTALIWIFEILTLVVFAGFISVDVTDLFLAFGIRLESSLTGGGAEAISGEAGVLLAANSYTISVGLGLIGLVGLALAAGNHLVRKVQMP